MKRLQLPRDVISLAVAVASASQIKPLTAVPSASDTEPMLSGDGIPAMKRPKADMGTAQISTAMDDACGPGSRTNPGLTGGPPDSA